MQTMLTKGGVGQHSQIQSLARQGSLYSLTLNEVQSHLGEPLNSMNLEELLRTVFPDEVNQPVGADAECAAGQCASGSGLQSQGSISMPHALSKKTVDEVWRGIQQEKKKGSKDQRPERQPTLGEITLEEFLVKVGVVVGGSAKKSNDGIGNAAPARNSNPMPEVQDFVQGTAHWLQYDQHQNVMGGYVPGCPVTQPMGISAGQMLDTMYSDSHMSISSPTMGALSDSQTSGRKRGASGHMADKLLERRQKRMIKNRESAARSRARKQAYTNELENKVSRLEEEIDRLKKQKELDKILFVPSPELKYQLRRTSSASF